MKNSILITIIACLISGEGFTQSITDSNMTFFGLDFSNARMIGGGFGNPAELRNNLFVEWNELFRAEPEKYELYKPFKKKGIAFDFSNVTIRNAAVDTAALETNSDYTLYEDQIEDEIKSYDTQGRSGLGLVFVVESFNKTKVLASIYVVFFDVATKKIILARRIEAPGAGFGLRNFWAKSIYAVIQYSKVLYPRWVKGKE